MKVARLAAKSAARSAALAGLLVAVAHAVAGHAAETTPFWVKETPPHDFRISSQSASYDPLGRNVWLSGTVPNYSFTSWRWNGTDWTGDANAGAPVSGATSALDPSVWRILRFGENYFHNYQLETWRLDGPASSWLSPRTQPSSKQGFLASDPAHGNVVFQTTPPDAAGSTWTWKRDDWSAVTSLHAPPAGYVGRADFDPALGKVVAALGSPDAGKLEIWTWDGADWARLATAHEGPAHSLDCWQFDAAYGAMVGFGGSRGDATFHETWLFTGNDWQRQDLAVHPPSGWSVCAYDPLRAALMVHGASGTWTYHTPGDVFDWVAAPASPPPGSHAPPPRSRAATAFDLRTGRPLIFGGLGNAGPLDDTWTWNGADWERATPLHSPSARSGASAVFDSTHGRLLLFGGLGRQYLDDTWTWNGADWRAEVPPVRPSPRAGAALELDGVRATAILFGGQDAGGVLDDTWWWNGSTWMEVASLHHPPGRSDASLVFDPASGDVVLFGGMGRSGALGDTWTWNGTDWTERSPLHAPSPRSGAAAAFHPTLGRVVLFGGDDGSGAGGGAGLADTWAWTDGDWVPIETPASPPGRHGAALQFDFKRASFVLFGGRDGGGGSSNGETAFGDTWVGGPFALREVLPLLVTVEAPPAPITGRAGWLDASDLARLGGRVTLQVSATDPSGVASLACTDRGQRIALSGEAGSNPRTAAVAIGAQGEHQVACIATDGASPPNSGALDGSSHPRSFRIDSVPPSLAPVVSGTGPGGAVLHYGSASVNPNASDTAPGSGVDAASASCATPDTSSAGTHSVTCTARDLARNVGTGTASYVVSTQLAHLGARFTAPSPSAVIPARSTVTIGARLLGANGARIADADAQAIAAACQLTVSAKRAQTLAPSCMTYDPPHHEFRYAWKLGRETGGATITVTMTYPGTPDVTVVSESITIAR